MCWWNKWLLANYSFGFRKYKIANYQLANQKKKKRILVECFCVSDFWVFCEKGIVIAASKSRLCIVTWGWITALLCCLWCSIQFCISWLFMHFTFAFCSDLWVDMMFQTFKWFYSGLFSFFSCLKEKPACVLRQIHK